MLNKQKGNMYGFVTHTWNVIKGKCPHDCVYCYMKIFPLGELRFDEKELKTDLGRNNFIFVGSSCDMFAEVIPKEWIIRVLNYCKKFPENTYLFQTKNPKRFLEFQDYFPINSIFGTTIETNYEDQIKKISNAPNISNRCFWINKIKFGKIFLTIEPIMDFDVEELVNMIKNIHPDFVNVGADSKNHNLPEPSAFKVEILIKELKKFTKSISKENLSRILITKQELLNSLGDEK
jgi:DNA repair photolyase